MDARSVGGGRYRLEGLLGAGGFARVFRAWDTRLGAACAVKILTVAPHLREPLRTRLRNEAHAMASVRHPHVLRVIDTGTDGDLDWIAMDLAPGGTLDDRVERDGPLDPRGGVLLVADVASALAAAHDAGIVHRDVKPSNLLLDDQGRVLLGDFGIARMDDDSLRTTRTDMAMGTLAYMAPEQRLDARSVSFAADQYALAASLYWLISGWNPVDLFTAEADSKRWDPIPDPLRPLLLRALSFAPDRRYPSLRDLERALRDVAPLLPTGPSRLAAAAHRTPTLVVHSEDRVPAVVRATSPDDATLPPTLPPPRTLPAGRLVPGLVGAALAGLLAGVGVWTLRSATPGAPPPAIPAAPAPEVVVPVPAPPPAVPDPAPPPVASPPAAPPPPRPVPQPPPTASPAPEVAAPTAPAPDPVGPPPVGRWEGSFGGRRCSLVLQGSPAALSGTLAVHFADAAVSSSVRGVLTGSDLALDDVDDGPDAGSYRLVLSEDGTHLNGTFSARHRAQTLPVAFGRR